VKTRTITNHDLVQLLLSLGFERAKLNEHYDLFTESKTDMAFPLPKGVPTAPARTSHVDGLRVQLAYRNLMDEAEFDARFSTPVAVKS
jgi:hypothetical protein